MGVAENPNFAVGTNRIVDAIIENQLTSIVGGGDTVAALNKAGVTKSFTYVSTAGGAFLEWLEGKDLPGVAGLTEN